MNEGETAMVSYNIPEARRSGDGIILLVGLQNCDAHLSVTFISEKQRTPNPFEKFVSNGSTPGVRGICKSAVLF